MAQGRFDQFVVAHSSSSGPLAGHIDLLAARLAADGYSRVRSRTQLRLVGHFNRWQGNSVRR